MELIFLGTGCMSPTKERNHQAIFLKYKKEGLLFDCGEGTQRQFFLANQKITKISKIFISHWHGDHVLGLPGLLQTLNNSEYTGKLQIFGPKNTKEKIEKLISLYAFDIGLDYKIIDIEEGRIVETDEYLIESVLLDHSIPCFGFSFIEKDRRKINLSYVKKEGIPEGPLLGMLQQNKDIVWKGKTIEAKKATRTVKGKKISFVMDTAICNGCSTLAKDSDLLVCESVYTKEHEKKAKEYKHMTAEQAGLLASRNNVKKLVLTHVSQRYKSPKELFEEGRCVFENTLCAYDFLKIRI